MSIELHFITAICYALATLTAWMLRPTSVAHHAGGVFDLRGSAVVTALTLAAVTLHMASVVNDLFAPSGFNLSFATSLSLLVALTLSLYAALAFASSKVDMVARMLAPAGLLAVLLPVLLPTPNVVPYGDQPLFKLHFVVAILAYVLFTVAALHALLMAFMENRLHAGDLPPAARGLPSLMRMEALLFQLVFAAFVLLTFTLVSGVFFSEAMFGKPFRFTHKTIFAVISWIIFATLLYGHWAWGWRGKKAVRLTLAGFVMLLLAYVGSKFVLEILLGRT